MKTLFAAMLFMASFTTSTQQQSQVYICTGPDAYRYHKTDRCRGLNRCTGEIRKVPVSYAQSVGFTACRICKPR